MEIELICTHGPMNWTSPAYLMRKIVLSDDSDISQVCKKLGVTEIAEWMWDYSGSLGSVVRRYTNEGSLEDGGSYKILDFVEGKEEGIKIFEGLGYTINIE